MPPCTPSCRGRSCTLFLKAPIDPPFGGCRPCRVEDAEPSPDARPTPSNGAAHRLQSTNTAASPGPDDEPAKLEGTGGVINKGGRVKCRVQVTPENVTFDCDKENPARAARYCRRLASKYPALHTERRGGCRTSRRSAAQGDSR